ncbi:MAG TPA: type II toxin-antitoxin system Phd/YefM family antitoxin [Candidatus Brocadiia bacterium]|nr:type II toxin-antitoxin system Phd/YefM family antitoxin [Candidatus Brocadiia bacterium]
MKASVLDLRYRMREVLAALERRERVSLQHRGKLKGTIIPANAASDVHVTDHPLFGITKDETETVGQQMERLRKRRYDDL